MRYIAKGLTNSDTPIPVFYDMGFCTANDDTRHRRQ